MNCNVSKINYSQLMSINEYWTNEYQLTKYCSTSELSNINECSTNEYSATQSVCNYKRVVCLAHPARERKVPRSLIGKHHNTNLMGHVCSSLQSELFWFVVLMMRRFYTLLTRMSEKTSLYHTREIQIIKSIYINMYNRVVCFSNIGSIFVTVRMIRILNVTVKTRKTKSLVVLTWC